MCPAPLRALAAALALLAAGLACGALGGGALAADPALAARAAPAARGAGAAGAIAEPRRPRPESLPAHEAARAAAAAAKARVGSIQASAWPAPHYANYSLASSRDTFEICKNQSGLRREISLEELLPIYGLPRELLARRHVPLAALGAALAAAAPAAHLVIAPLLAGEAELSPVLHPDGKLPRLVHFTVREKDAMLPHQALAIASWARLNPGYSILLYDDADISEFMATYHPRHVPLFDALGSQVERTDLWRYLVLCTFGGVYADSDVVAGRPVSTWAQDAGLLTGVENVFETMAAARRRDYTGVMQIVQWTIAARPGHPAVCRMGDYIRARVEAEAGGAAAEEDRDHAILERTGPGIWSRSVHDYLRDHGAEPESLVGGGKVGDVRVLPQSTFGCASSTVNLADPVAYVYHMFKGSWRLHEPGKLWQFITHLYAHLFEAPPAPAGAAGAAAARARGASPAVGAGTGAGRLTAQQKQQVLRAGGGGCGGADGPQEQRLRAEQLGAAGLAPPLQRRGGGGDVAPHPRDGLRLLPVASVLVVAALVCSALAQRGGGRCGRASTAGAAGGAVAARQSAASSVALAGIWGGARRLAGGLHSGGGAASGGGGGAPLLPLLQQQGALPPKGSSAAALLERPPAAGGLARQQGSSTGGCLKRSGGSMQCLHSTGSMQ